MFILYTAVKSIRNGAVSLDKGAENTAPPPFSNPYTTEQLQRMRKQTEDEIAAFQELMNYNADVAYGIKKRGEE